MFSQDVQLPGPRQCYGMDGKGQHVPNCTPHTPTTATQFVPRSFHCFHWCNWGRCSLAYPHSSGPNEKASAVPGQGEKQTCELMSAEFQDPALPSRASLFRPPPRPTLEWWTWHRGSAPDRLVQPVMQEATAGVQVMTADLWAKTGVKLAKKLLACNSTTRASLR